MFAGFHLSEGCPSTGRRSDMSASTGLLGSILETRTQPAFNQQQKSNTTCGFVMVCSCSARNLAHIRLSCCLELVGTSVTFVGPATPVLEGASYMIHMILVVLYDCSDSFELFGSPGTVPLKSLKFCGKSGNPDSIAWS